MVGGFARSVEAEQLLASGWAHEIAPPRDALRSAVTVSIAGATDFELDRDPLARATRMPKQVYDAVAAGLERGPVLLQTPRRGYAATLACERCRTPARCAVCTGPLAVSGPALPPACRWCGTVEEAWACAVCGHRGLRAPVVGERRTAEELGRAFPSTPVVASGGDHVVETVPAKPAIVVATPGAEPVAADGYRTVILLDTWLALARPDLRTDEEALRRWLGAAGLAAPGAGVVAVGDPTHPALQALVRWDPAGFARRETAARSEAHLPPASRLATITGEPGAVDDALTLLDRPPGTEVLGPVQVDDGESRLVVRAPRGQGSALSRALGEVQRVARPASSTRCASRSTRSRSDPYFGRHPRGPGSTTRNTVSVSLRANRWRPGQLSSPLRSDEVSQMLPVPSAKWSPTTTHDTWLSAR